jgi:hypothetical protein
MRVKHKVSGKEFTVSDDYFDKYEDSLEVLEVIEAPKRKPKRKPKTKVVNEDAPAVTEGDETVS